MATFNLAGSSILNLTPTRQANGRDTIRFSQEMFNLKRTTPLSSVDYWRVQGDQIAFISVGTVTHVHVGLRGVHFIAFDVTEYQNLSHIVPRQWPLAGSVAMAFTQSQAIAGRGWPRSRIHSLRLSESNSVTLSEAYFANNSHSIAFTQGNSLQHNPIRINGASSLAFTLGNSLTRRTRFLRNSSSSLTFTLTPVATRILRRVGVSSIAFTISGTTRPARSLFGETTLTFGSSGSTVPVSNPFNYSTLLFTDYNSLQVVKKVSAAHAVELVSGGFGLVY